MRRICASGNAPSPTRTALKSQASKRPLDAAFTDLCALTPKGCVQPRASIRPSALGVHRSEPLAECLITVGTSTRRASGEGVIALPCHSEQPAEGRDGERSLLRVDECELHSLSFAKKAAAFFRIARS